MDKWLDGWSLNGGESVPLGDVLARLGNNDCLEE